jgi:hypothetical protein
MKEKLKDNALDFFSALFDFVEHLWGYIKE